KVVPGWGTTPVMAGLGVMLLIFMLTILQIYNKSLLIQGISVDWTGLG
ncbi:MAG: photosystem II reaction center protein PsbH, partial [Prochlorococcus sp.]